jgi:hypothetical protein
VCAKLFVMRRCRRVSFPLQRWQHGRRLVDVEGAPRGAVRVPEARGLAAGHRGHRRAVQSSVRGRVRDRQPDGLRPSCSVRCSAAVGTGGSELPALTAHTSLTQTLACTHFLPPTPLPHWHPPTHPPTPTHSHTHQGGTPSWSHWACISTTAHLNAFFAAPRHTNNWQYLQRTSPHERQAQSRTRRLGVARKRSFRSRSGAKRPG